MSKKRPSFPMEVPSGSVVAKIYRVKNKAYRGKDQSKDRYSYTVSLFAGGKRTMKMFVSFEDAHAHAKSIGNSLSNGELDVLELRSADRQAYVHALAALQPTGMPLELAAKDYAEAWKVLGGKASLIEAAQEYARRHLPELPPKMLPEAVQDMLADKERDKASNAYLKVLRFYLGKLADSFQCQLRAVTTQQLADFFRTMTVSLRTKNNARAAVGAFFKYCKERGWLGRDHDGVSLIPKFKVKSEHIEIFTPHEMAQFLSYCRVEMIPFLAIGAFAGLRTAEIERLDWAEVHLSERFIEVKAAKAKTASRRLVPISDNLVLWLSQYAKDSGRVVPFDNVPKQIGWLVQDTNKGLREEAAKLGKDPKNVKSLAWKKNALRHSYISYRVADIQDVPKVALECGNSPKIIFQNYRELVRPVEAKSWFSIAPGDDGKTIFIDPRKEKPKNQAEQQPGAKPALAV